MSPLFEVRSLRIADVAGADLLEKAATAGWWAFVLDGKKPIGTAVLTLTDHAIVFGGVNTGKLTRRAIAALAKGESMIAERETSAWFLHIASLYFTAVVIEGGGERVFIPIGGPPRKVGSVQESLAARAARRIASASALRDRNLESQHPGNGAAHE